MDFDNVKPDADVKVRTGFRRLLYQRKRAPVDKDIKEERRKDQLRYPWDYTQGNIYHKKPKPRENKKKLRLWERITAKEEEPKEPYPEYDPLGVYKPRTPKERKPLEETETEKEVKKMPVSQVLIKAKAKAAVAKTERDPSDEADIMFERLINRPLPKSGLEDFVPATGDLYDFSPSYMDGEKLDPGLSKKIKAGRDDLAEFERMLDAKFSKKHRLMHPVPPPLVKGAKRSSALFTLADPDEPLAKEAAPEAQAADTEGEVVNEEEVKQCYSMPQRVTVCCEVNCSESSGLLSLYPL